MKSGVLSMDNPHLDNQSLQCFAFITSETIATIYNLGNHSSFVKSAVIRESSDHSRIAALICIGIVIQEVKDK